MNNDIIPPRPPVNVPPRPPQQPIAESTEQPRFVVQTVAESVDTPVQNQTPPPVAPIIESDDRMPSADVPPRKPYVKWVLIALAGLLLLGLALVAWYLMALRPVLADADKRVNVTITSGSSPAAIGELLQEKKVIRSRVAFSIYTRLESVRNKLQAGSFSLSPADSTAQVVASLTSGTAEQFDITFYPGATISIASTDADKTPSHRQVLQKLGYADDEITEAFTASYVAEYPLLFSDKPASADLEGYIYGQTYRIMSGSSVKQILMRTFDEYEAQIRINNLIGAYKAQDLTLYEGITLASIIQREVPTQADQKQVAQVFLKRYRDGGTLGSDVTYHYAADKQGVARTHELDSPYNTRKVAGLPPGPIASPGISALVSVASPAPGDYMYFLSGDDSKTYYAQTNEEHEANIIKHCAYKCSLP